MRELLREVYDRLGECTFQGFNPTDPEKKIARFRDQVADVLASGLFDGRMTAVDMRSLPPVLR